MLEPIEKCVHCGFCLAACPTYSLLGEEMDSPRGRIYLMKNVLEERLDAEEAQPYIDRCLGCMACVPACPSGVEYGDLLVSYRALQEEERSRSLTDALTRKLVCETLPYPKRFRLAVRGGKDRQVLRRAAARCLWRHVESAAGVTARAHAAAGDPARPRRDRRGVVALLLGCAQQVLAPEINYAAAHVLAANGVEVHIPRGQSCCGSILTHVGAENQARQLARGNFPLMPDNVDAIITTAAGCGSGIKDYELLFKGEDDAGRARAFSLKVMDFSAYLAALGLRPPAGFAAERIVAYQDACHLLHAQGHEQEPRVLLRQIPNLRLATIADAGMCCGSAGTYNIDQPSIAAQLGKRKAAAILAAQPDVIVSGNIGCITQIRAHLRRQGDDRPVMHLAELLHQAYNASS